MKIEWTNPAILDLQNIRDYIAKDSDLFAAGVVEQIIETVERLPEFPEIGRQVPEAEDKNIRERIFQNYRIIYRIDRQRILILGILHAARDLSRLRPWDAM